ncbi:helix-turn-helix transcriptional regulator [Nocardia alni]|uniref:helix-turn-helix transcriptional regulator n=1 Tax=Nocardia alni TaxID=2815723 RepID=UPI001C2470ED|nr:helix-turn-helix transcriptional regulator [Nocardia alni]
MAGNNRNGLADYLRQRRAAMTPPGLNGRPRTSRRRVLGLRRQEMADLTGISVEYYTRMEQGKAPRPSREILAALAKGLALTGPERDHLFRLGGESPPELPEPGAVIRPGLLRMLQGLDETMPVTVHDGRLDLLARNELAAELLPPMDESSPYGRNIVYQAFTTTALTTLLGDDADRFLRVAAAELRTALSRYPADAYLRDILAELTATSAIFRDYWGRGEVIAWRSAVKQLRHPTIGMASFDIELLHDPERDHWVMLYIPHKK